MTTVIVAEKPSVARDIAAVLGARKKAEGFLHGNGYQITWALGHLVHFAEPDDYDTRWAGRWSMAQLPMIPAHWKLRTDRRTVKQFDIVKALLKHADTERVVCATDAGREGELIFRLILEHARCRKPVQRLWISSLTEEAIRAGLQHLRPGSDYDPLAAAARARAQADWLVGMNLTRAYSVHNRLLCTIGRVQTPTLAMIVERDALIANFTKVYFYELVAHLAEGFDARYSLQGETRIDRKEQAERLQRSIAQAIEPHRTGKVTAVEKKIRNNRPPPLYDLTNLQRDANRRFGLTAAKVLELAQSLYETHKLISYPRTESRHIGEDMLPQLPRILSNLEHPLAAEASARLAAGHRLGKAYVDKTKLTDHHAILPTAKTVPAHLSEPLRRIYDLVVERFVGVFLPDQKVEETLVRLDIGGETFIARGSVELEPGWKRVDPRRRKAEAQPIPGRVGADPGAAKPDPSAEHRALPPLQKGQIVHVDGLEVVEKETQPPRPFDDATLLNAMKQAGRNIDDDALAAAIKSCGLGTSATRAEIIEKLLRTGYIERQRKQLRATDKGKALIGMVAAPLRSVETTAAWEQRLQDVEQGSADADAFYRDICKLIGELIPQVEQGPAMTAEQIAAARAVSSKHAASAGRGAGRGKSKGARRSGSSGSKLGGTGNASNIDQQQAHNEAADQPVNPAASAGLGICPICKQGAIVENPKAYGCEHWRDGCGFTIWKTVCGQRLTKTQVKQLIDKGKTDLIEGFLSKSGNRFKARLRLDANGRVGFDFEQKTETEAKASASQAPRPGAGRRASRSAQAANTGAKAAQPDALPGDPMPNTDPPATAQSLRDNPLQCPQCHIGFLIEGRRAFGCNRWREGCNFVVPKQTDGHLLSERELRNLVERAREHPVQP